MNTPTNRTTISFDQAYPIELAAELAGCSVETLRRAVRRREIAAIRNGARGHIKIRASALDSWLKRQTISALRAHA